jgi:hypothetical protein
MTDRADQDVVHGRYARLTGLVPQLTTPSRHHSELVDIWFAVQWTERDPDWDATFARLSNGRRPDPDNPSFFALFSHAACNGLIVARHVSPDPGVWQKVEEAARAVIELVNADVAARREPSSNTPGKGLRAWSLRVRDATAFLASLGWFNDQKPALPAVTELPIQVSPRSARHTR